MAKAADIDIDPAEPFAQAGARIVRIRAEELFEHADGVLDTSDIERVHAMRVASRRLRAVLEIFSACFPKEQYADVLSDVKRIADALGMRRDPDVHIAGMQRFAAELHEAQRPGIELLIADLRDEQATGNEALAVELERMRATELDRRLRALADDAEVPA
jgi:CHAD domain-containing protein